MPLESVWQSFRRPRSRRPRGPGPEVGKALTLIGRVAGLVAHAFEERSRPIGQDLWDMAAAASESGEP